MRADLALVGFGHVGRRFARLIEERRDWLSLDYDLDCRIVGIATRRHGAIFRDTGLDAVAMAGKIEEGHSIADAEFEAGDSFDVIQRLSQSHAPLKVVIETTTLDIEAGQPAVDHVRAALQAGCHVTTANKGPTAFAHEELSALADDRGRSFLFEGAVMDGVPIFNLVRETLPAVQLTGFRGVVNSTTNHILSALANVLMRARMTPQAVDREGIGPGTARLAMAAKARGARVRLVASARTTPEGVVTAVRPVELPETDVLAGLRGMANALVLQTDLLGEIAILQMSGSLTQTAYALLSDLITIRRRQPRAPHAAAPGRTP
jgi:homoserine dehydrogenase